MTADQFRIQQHVKCIMKKPFMTLIHAQKYAKHLKRNSGTIQYAYTCAKCKKYHLSTKNPAIYEAKRAQQIKERNEMAAFLGVTI